MRRVRGKGKRRELIAVALSAVALAAANPNVAIAATDIFVKLGDIKGESLDDKHKDEIEVLSWSWGVVGPTRNSPGQPGQPVGRAQPSCAQEITIDKVIDKSSPILFMTAAAGKTIPTGTFSVRKSGENPQEYLVIKLSDIVVTSISQGGSGGDIKGTEGVSFGFSGGTITYTPTTIAGAVGTPVVATIPASCR
jgi:type VI secretion system secreted protein Hcp